MNKRVDEDIDVRWQKAIELKPKERRRIKRKKWLEKRDSTWQVNQKREPMEV